MRDEDIVAAARAVLAHRLRSANTLTLAKLLARAEAGDLYRKDLCTALGGNCPGTRGKRSAPANG